MITYASSPTGKRVRRISPLQGYWILIASTIPLWAVVAQAQIFPVINVDDSGPGSLRYAISNANLAVGSTKIIQFGIPQTNPVVNTIFLNSPLPSITNNSVIIDGYSQAFSRSNTLAVGNDAQLVIELNGSNTNLGAVEGLTIMSTNCVVQGLAIKHFGGDGIFIEGGGGNIIQGNFIGSNGFSGVNVLSSPNNAIGGAPPGARNVISANGGSGISLNESLGNLIQGNFIGTDTTGTTSMGNFNEGINVLSSSSTVVLSNTISGNRFEGVSVSDSMGNVIQANLIGTDATGTLPLGNFRAGVSFFDSASGNLIGGLTAELGNLISANQRGIEFSFAEVPPIANQVQGNRIGTDATGTRSLGNTQEGVFVSSGNNFIGGTEVGAGNIISANAFSGVAISGLSGTNNLVQGNFIGADVTGTNNLGNAQDGVFITGSDNDIVGNVISFNNANGVEALTNATGNAVLSNSIFSNRLLGINNRVLNFPVLNSAISNDNNIVIPGTQSSTADTEYRIEFFASSMGDPSGYGQGQSFIGWTNVTTDSSGNAAFTASFSVGIPTNWVITATATGLTNNTTSQFSHWVKVLLPPPVVSFSARPINGPAPLTVSFDNLSSGAASYVWNFGDGHTSTELNTVNIYTNAGIYTVSLVAVGQGGTSTLTRTNYIHVTAPDLIGYWQGFLSTNITKRCAYTAHLMPYITLSGAFRVANIGTAPAASTVVKFFLSTDRVLDPGDLLVDTFTCIPLAKNQTKQIFFQFILPPCVASKGKFLISVVNAGGHPIIESNTRNNINVLGPLP